jgi:hypothetical protein
MKNFLRESNKEKHLFKSYYCAGCKQRKPCGKLTDWDSDWKSYCCPCYYQSEQAKAEKYSNYQQVYQIKEQERQAYIKQYQLLRNYLGCKQCGSKEIDAYELYENKRLVCWNCLVKKAGGASSPISFLEQQKWFKKQWGINLTEWLEKYGCLPVNKSCADKWLKDKQHLKNCQCLEQESKEVYELFANSLRKMEEKLKKCACETSEKVRVSGDYYAWCEKCKKSIAVASKKRVIKNRNDPRFWGLSVKEKVLCGKCLEKSKEKMPPLRRAKFNEYKKLGRI